MYNSQTKNLKKTNVMIFLTEMERFVKQTRFFFRNTISHLL